MLKHLVKEFVKVEDPLASLRVEAHPKIKSRPFRGIQGFRLRVSPPPRIHDPIGAFKQLLVSFRFTVRTGCAVQVVSTEADSVDIFIVLNDVNYAPPPLPQRRSVSYSREDFDRLTPGVGTKIFAAEGIATFVGLLGGPLNAARVAAILARGIESDQYDPLPQIDINDKQHAVPINNIPAGAGIVIDNGQPYPIYGWLEARWADPGVVALGAPPDAGQPLA